MNRFQQALLALPGSFQGAPSHEGPYGVLGLGEGALPAELLQSLVSRRLTSSGTQFVLASRDWEAAAEDYVGMAEVSGARVARLGQGDLSRLAGLVERGVLSTYHYAQWVATATGHTHEAAEAERVLADLAARCAPDVEEGNPARELAWTLWTRAPLLLAPQGENFLVWAWQTLLARVGKTLAIPVERDALYVVTGAFEARHETGDGRVALILGEEDEEMALAREVLQTRVDEVVTVPFPEGSEGYAGSLGLWYFGLWVAAYLAERYEQSPEDAKALREVLASLEQDRARESRGDLN
ncbi:SIS domain-containing protein [Deinococcus pimensis]|uniref:SIS domain-containing protein n=1 Tax=Deinococcus pimensis TaxID=309888 RepID=UPI000483772F|nr:SIS domain-containing protein [Deinococcus pimensis]